RHVQKRRHLHLVPDHLIHVVRYHMRQLLPLLPKPRIPLLQRRSLLFRPPRPDKITLHHHRLLHPPTPLPLPQLQIKIRQQLKSKAIGSTDRRPPRRPPLPLPRPIRDLPTCPRPKNLLPKFRKPYHSPTIHRPPAFLTFLPPRGSDPAALSPHVPASP